MFQVYFIYVSRMIQDVQGLFKDNSSILQQHIKRIQILYGCFARSLWDREISPFSPANEIGTGNSTSQVLLLGLGSGMDFDQSANETRTGPYLVLGLIKVPGNFHWSRKWDQEREFYCSGPINGNETGNCISPVPLMRLGQSWNWPFLCLKVEPQIPRYV